MQIDANHIIVIKITFATLLREKKKERFVLFHYKAVYNNRNITRQYYFDNSVKEFIVMDQEFCEHPADFDLWNHLNLVFVVPFSSQAKLITGLESLRFPSLRFRVFYTENTTSPSVRRQWERRVSDEIRRRREWIPRADGCSSDVIVRTRHGLCMRLSWLIVTPCKCCIILDDKKYAFWKISLLRFYIQNY